MRWQALADGIIDAAYNIVMERRRNPEQQSSDWINQWIDEIANALKAIENNISEVEGDVTLANIAIASAIGYLDFRLPEILHNNSAVLNAHPQLALWYSKFEKRSSMVSTKPQ